MILTVDIGNSNTVLVGYNKNKEIVYKHRVLTFKKETDSLLRKLLMELKLEVEAVVISCVVPSILDTISNVFEEVYQIKPIIINGHTIDKLEINIETPTELGADLIATSVGAISKTTTPVIVADIGSASKITLTNKGNVYEGGIILPGIGSSLQSMVDMIPHLPKVDLELPSTVIGKNTIHAIQSGMLYGIVAQIEGLSNQIETEVGIKCTRILTGGYSILFKDLLPEFQYEDDLVNDGLIEIYLKKMYK